MLIRDAAVYGREGCSDVRLADGHVDAIGCLTPLHREAVLNANGGALLPGLHDHHVHVMAFAAAVESVACGPPAVRSAAQLSAALSRAAEVRSDGWIRGVGYHDSVAGALDRAWLDRHGPARPIRIQHRSGRLWMMNSRALSALAAADRRTPLPADGRLYDADLQLRALAGTGLPPVAQASRMLARYGVTGITDMTPHNDDEALATFRRLRADGSLLQTLRLAGRLALEGSDGDGVTVGETKIHLHEADLPPFDELLRTVRTSHDRGRPVAVHCVTETELVFALAAIGEAGALAGDRIEHASVTPPALLEQIRALQLVVVTQPNFVAERGEAYLREIPSDEHDWLYRCRSFLDAAIPLAGGTDMPFGSPDPWAAMQAAVTRQTPAGQRLGAAEKLTPEQALALFSGAPETPALPRAVAVGTPADLCLLDCPWQTARGDLRHERVAATFVRGSLVWSR